MRDLRGRFLTACQPPEEADLQKVFRSPVDHIFTKHQNSADPIVTFMAKFSVLSVLNSSENRYAYFNVKMRSIFLVKSDPCYSL